MQNTIKKLIEVLFHWQKTPHRPEGQEDIPCKSLGGFRPGKCTCDNAAAFAYDAYDGFQRTNTVWGNWCEGHIQQGPVQATSEYGHAIWNQPDNDLVDCNSTPKKNCDSAAWKLKPCIPSAHSGLTTRLTTLASCTMYPPRTWQTLKWDQLGITPTPTYRQQAHIQSNKGHPGGSQSSANNNWIKYPCGDETPDISSMQTMHKLCYVSAFSLDSKEQQTKWCQKSHFMQLKSNEQNISDTWDWIW